MQCNEQGIRRYEVEYRISVIIVLAVAVSLCSTGAFAVDITTESSGTGPLMGMGTTSQATERMPNWKKARNGPTTVG